ncbi:MAG: glycosyltransferase family 4 protein [Thermoguttaceae bacterium]
MKHRRYKLGIVTTHPIQYQVPWFQRLAQMPELDLTVFFCHLPDRAQQGDGFGVSFQWDVPLLEGYHYQILKNVARRPSVTRFRGCDTPEIGRQIGQGEFDAVVVNGWVVKSCLQTLWACKRSGVPCIVRGEANILRPRAWWKRRIHRWLVRRYAACLYIGRSNAQFYRQCGVRQERLFPARYFVDNERFARQAGVPGLRESARGRWNVPQDRTVYLYSGKLIPKKHPLELLESLRLASRKAPGVHLLVVGDGELRAGCESFAAAHHLPATFTGFLNQTEIPAAYAAADCLVLPADHGETWGLVVNEAMACGLPAVISDQVGCGPDLIEPGRTGAVFPFGNWEALAQTLVDLAASPDALRRQGENARAKVAEYSVEAAARGTLDAVRYVVGQVSTRLQDNEMG